jgi:hypothetical protein
MDILQWLLVRNAGDLEDRLHAQDMIRRRARASQARVNRELASEVESLRAITAALVDLCLEKGLVSEDELKARLTVGDAAAPTVPKKPKTM